MEQDIEAPYLFQITENVYISFDVASYDGISLGIVQNNTNPLAPYEIANGKRLTVHELRELGKVIQTMADGYEKMCEVPPDDSSSDEPDDLIGNIDWKWDYDA